MISQEAIQERSDELEKALAGAGAPPAYIRHCANGSRAFMYAEDRSERYVMVFVYDEDYMIVVRAPGVGSTFGYVADLAKVVDEVVGKTAELGLVAKKEESSCPG